MTHTVVCKRKETKETTTTHASHYSSRPTEPINKQFTTHAEQGKRNRKLFCPLSDIMDFRRWGISESNFGVSEKRDRKWVESFEIELFRFCYVFLGWAEVGRRNRIENQS